MCCFLCFFCAFFVVIDVFCVAVFVVFVVFVVVCVAVAAVSSFFSESVTYTIALRNIFSVEQQCSTNVVTRPQHAKA